MGRVLQIVLAACTFMTSAPAYAQTRFAVVPVGSSRFVAQRERAEVRVVEVLSEQGYRRVDSAELPRLLNNSRCDVVCAADINRLLGTSFAVLVEVLGTNNRAQMVNVALITNREGASVGGQAAIDRDTSIEEAAEQATHQALDRYAADNQGYVIVDSEPNGGSVSIDGTVVGSTPLRRLVPQGTHRVTVSLDGYAPLEHEVAVVAHGEHPVQATLVAASGVVTPPQTATVSSGPDVGLLLAGGGLIALGLVLFAVLPLPTLLQSGQCAVMDGGHCVEGYRFDAHSWTFSALSLVSVVTGVVLGVLGLSSNAPAANAASQRNRDFHITF